ncbi:hypothetical protein OUZ56_026449 [Daphnia magna]|uniref:Uncharacterized protein n=1 Tax=Daphnia magna TaxID=35525 RepID=A0ABQ9ZLS5_9CRUS|nr:hypothetical protein OUZ56_026449 [Daphnia magna]
MALSAMGIHPNETHPDVCWTICRSNPIPRIKESSRRRKTSSRNVSESDGQEMDSMIPENIYGTALEEQMKNRSLDDLPLQPRNHPAHGTMEMEQLNILNDLVGRINEGEGKELPDILVTEEQDNQIITIFLV